MMFSKISRTIRNIRRAQEIVSVLARYGFTDVLQEFGIDRFVESGRRKLRMIKPDEEIIRLPRAVRLRRVLEELGPTFIKLAQVLATRPDLIPADWAEEFARLQDQVTPVPFDEIKKVIDEELGDHVELLLTSIEEESLAVASIAQVHRAVLKDGTDVVLKILRPGVREVLRSDMEILSALASFVEHRFSDMGYSPLAVVEQFDRELKRELDYTIEGRATDRMRQAFEDDPGISFPRVFTDIMTPSILCLEYIEGTLLSQYKPEDFTPEQRRVIVTNGVKAIFRQCLEIGFFHADPHPGNIIVLKDEDGQPGPICFIDCGMTGHIDPKTAEYLADITQGTVAGEIERVIDVVIALSDSDPGLASDRAFRNDVWEFIGHFENASFSSLRIGALLQEFFDKLRQHHLRCPADIVFLIKAITTIEGVGEQLCPEFDIVEVVRPSVEKLVRRRYGFRAIRSRFQNSLIGYAELTEKIPREIGSLFSAIRKQKLTVNLEHRGLDRLTKTIEHASRNVARALIVMALVIASSILILSDSASPPAHGWLTYLAIFGFLIAALLTGAMITIGRVK